MILIMKIFWDMLTLKRQITTNPRKNILLKMIAYDDFLREGKKEFFNHKILAHTKNWNSQETLKVHSSLTLKYFNKLLLTFGLDNVAEKLISDVFPDEKKEYIREFIECIVYFHDIGKINPNYQKKLNNIISIDTTLK